METEIILCLNGERKDVMMKKEIKVLILLAFIVMLLVLLIIAGWTFVN
ncbi:MAG: hypothetical protein WC438_02815 [Candidatus Pacearchaeota archaeon]